MAKIKKLKIRGKDNLDINYKFAEKINEVIDRLNISELLKGTQEQALRDCMYKINEIVDIISKYPDEIFGYFNKQ